MRNVFTWLLVIALAPATLAQKITLSGKVIDKETKEPLPFATLGIKDKSIGTITNLQGEFDFHIPADLRNDLFMLSMLGYKPFSAPVWTLMDAKPLVIEVEKSTLMLNEVTVADSLRGGEILMIALSRIEQNYPMQPYLMDGFYRDLKKVGGTYISLLEAAVKIYDEDYSEPRNKYKLRERVALQEVRRSIGYASRFTSYFDQDNLLEDLLLHNSVRYRHFPLEELFYESLTREKDTEYNNQQVFVISYSLDYRLRVYVEKSNYAIIHVEFESTLEEPLTKKRGMESRFVRLKRVIDFKPFLGKYYLNYLTVDSNVNWYDIRTKELKFETELNQSLLINEVVPNTIRRVPATEKMRNYGLQYQDQPYNKAFWDNYNVIKESPLDRKILQDLERHGPLEKQFKNQEF
ncbi:MAG: carboxypeptidase-like regulatory domain-containing protein [Bacteroidetes bacterium CHB5]|nr:carboxypeptidase-like regulatory domain-containing protein [Bacteroidetes bacterium CHB5]